MHRIQHYQLFKGKLRHSFTKYNLTISVIVFDQEEASSLLTNDECYTSSSYFKLNVVKAFPVILRKTIC